MSPSSHGSTRIAMSARASAAGYAAAPDRGFATRPIFPPWAMACAIAASYSVGVLLLHGAFVHSTNPKLRHAWLDWFSLQPPVAAPGRAALLFLLGIACFFAGYALILRRSVTAQAERRPRTAAFMLALLCLLFVSVPPFLSTDVLSYFQQGWLIAEHEANPYLTPPGAFGVFPGIEFMKGQNHQVLTPYGPVWSWIEALVYSVSGGALWLGVTIFKLLAAASVLVLVRFVWIVQRRNDPTNAWRAALFVGANPLLLVEGPGMAHNDLFALAMAFGGVALISRGGEIRAAGGLALVGVCLLVKALAAMVPLALAFYWLRNFGLARLLRLGFRAALLWAPVAVASAVEFVSRPADIPLLFGAANARLPYEIRYTPINVLRDLLAKQAAAAGLEVDPGRIKLALLTIAFAAVLTLMIALLMQARRLLGALRALGPGYLAATVAASYWRQWYAVWPVPFVALGAGRAWMLVAIAYSAGALLTYAMTKSAGIHY